MAILRTASDDGADGTAKPTIPADAIPGAEFVRMLAAAMADV